MVMNLETSLPEEYFQKFTEPLEMVGELMQIGKYYKPKKEPLPGWTHAVDGSGLKPTLQTKGHECCS